MNTNESKLCIFKKYKVQKLDKLQDAENFEFCNLNKRNLIEYHYFSKREFEKYQKQHDVRIIGNIKINQKKYRNPFDYPDVEKEINKKNKQHIIGCVAIDYIEKEKSKRTAGVQEKRFDLYEPQEKHCVGYASVGGNEFVRMTKSYIFILVVIVMLLISVGLMFSYCHKANSIEPWKTIEVGESIIETTNNQNSENQDFIVLNGFSKYTINADNKKFALHNSEKNDVYMVYTIYNEDSGELLFDMKKEYPNQMHRPDSYYPIDIYDKLTQETTHVKIVIECYDMSSGYQCDGGITHAIIIKK